MPQNARERTAIERKVQKRRYVFCLTGRLQGFFERSNEMVHIANHEIANDELEANCKSLQSEFTGEFTCIGLEGHLTLTFQSLFKII
jgi:hypothetical protein